MHNICFVMQGKKLGRDLGEMEAWEHMKLVTPGSSEPRPAPAKYFGKAKENKEKYCEEFAKLHPEVAMMVAGSACRMAVLPALLGVSSLRGTSRRSRLPSPPAATVPPRGLHTVLGQM